METILKQAQEYNIPIMQQDGIEFLTKFIKENNIKTVLEIGSAIGYSAIKMALVDKNIKITTIERDIDRYNMAIDNIKRLNFNNQIKIINDDFFNFDVTENYDLVFIDAAKAQYIKFFEKVQNNTKYIISDNLAFHGLVGTSGSIKSSNLRSLVSKIERYIIFLKENKNFTTTFYEIGDGIAVSTKND